MKSIIHKLDCMVQEIASRNRSEIDGSRQGIVAHHIFGRSNQYLRWQPDNWFFCTPQQHDLIHRGILKVDSYVSPKRMGNLISLRAESLTWKPNDEFYKQTEKKLKELLK